MLLLMFLWGLCGQTTWSQEETEVEDLAAGGLAVRSLYAIHAGLTVPLRGKHPALWHQETRNFVSKRG